MRGYVQKTAAAGKTAKKVLVLGADEPPSDVEAEQSSDSELDELAQLLDFGPGWDASNDSVQLPDQSADVAGAASGWRDSACADSSDSDNEQGSVLAFLPGQREIERTAERLAGRVSADTDVIALFGNMESRAQDAAIRPAPAGRRKVVLATSIAETSITIDGGNSSR